MKLIASGNTAEVFDYGDGKVCKLFKAGYPLEAVHKEYDNTLIMNRSSISTPKIYEIIEHEGRHGIIFQKISGEDLLTELKKNLEDGEKAARILMDMANLQKKLLLSETTEGISYKDFIRSFGYPKVDELPDGNNVCHGDLHPGNIIRVSEYELCLIDFMNVCRGPKEYDVARTYVLLTENNPAGEMIGGAYLQMMEMSYDQVSPYLEAVRYCRGHEMA